jgi:hypothetical protein
MDMMLLIEHPNIISHLTWWKEKYVKKEIMNENRIKYFLIMRYAENGNLFEDLTRKIYTNEVRFKF